MTDDQLLGFFLEGIDQTTRNFVSLRMPQTLAEAANMASQLGVEDRNVVMGLSMLGVA